MQSRLKIQHKRQRLAVFVVLTLILPLLIPFGGSEKIHATALQRKATPDHVGTLQRAPSTTPEDPVLVKTVNGGSAISLNDLTQTVTFHLTTQIPKELPDTPKFVITDELNEFLEIDRNQLTGTISGVTISLEKFLKTDNKVTCDLSSMVQGYKGEQVKITITAKLKEGFQSEDYYKLAVASPAYAIANTATLNVGDKTITSNPVYIFPPKPNGPTFKVYHYEAKSNQETNIPDTYFKLEPTDQNPAPAHMLSTDSEVNRTINGLADGSYRLSVFHMDPSFVPLDRIAGVVVVAGQITVHPDPALPEGMVSVSKEGNVTTVKVKSERKTTDVTFQKVTEEVENGSQQGLAEAKFKLSDDFNSSNVYEATSGSDGTVTFNDIPPGRYTLEETAAPEGYILSKTKYAVYVIDNGGELEVEIKKAPKAEQVTGEISKIINYKMQNDRLIVYKVDEVSQRPIGGAQFKLYEKTRTVSIKLVIDDNKPTFEDDEKTELYKNLEVQLLASKEETGNNFEPVDSPRKFEPGKNINFESIRQIYKRAQLKLILGTNISKGYKFVVSKAEDSEQVKGADYTLLVTVSKIAQNDDSETVPNDPIGLKTNYRGQTFAAYGSQEAPDSPIIIIEEKEPEVPEAVLDPETKERYDAMTTEELTLEVEQIRIEREEAASELARRNEPDEVRSRTERDNRLLELESDITNLEEALAALSETSDTMEDTSAIDLVEEEPLTEAKLREQLEKLNEERATLQGLAEADETELLNLTLHYETAVLKLDYLRQCLIKQTVELRAAPVQAEATLAPPEEAPAETPDIIVIDAGEAVEQEDATKAENNEAVIVTLNQRLETLRIERDDITRQIETTKTELTNLETELEEVQIQIASREEELAALTREEADGGGGEDGDVTTKPSPPTPADPERDIAIAQLKTQLMQLQDRRQDLELEIAMRETDLAVYEKRIQELDATITELEERLAILQIPDSIFEYGEPLDLTAEPEVVPELMTDTSIQLYGMRSGGIEVPENYIAVQDPDTQKDLVYTTNDDGIIEIKDLPPGLYFLMESQPADSYDANDEAFTYIKVTKEGDNTKYEISKDGIKFDSPVDGQVTFENKRKAIDIKDLSLEKVWYDQKGKPIDWPKGYQLKLTLYQNGLPYALTGDNYTDNEENKVKNGTLLVDASGFDQRDTDSVYVLKQKIKALPTKTEDGQEAKYSFSETIILPDNATRVYTPRENPKSEEGTGAEAKIVFENQDPPRKIRLRIEKTWVYNDPEATTHPTSFTVTLKRKYNNTIDASFSKKITVNKPGDSTVWIADLGAEDYYVNPEDPSFGTWDYFVEESELPGFDLIENKAILETKAELDPSYLFRLKNKEKTPPRDSTLRLVIRKEWQGVKASDLPKEIKFDVTQIAPDETQKSLPSITLTRKDHADPENPLVWEYIMGDLKYKDIGAAEDQTYRYEIQEQNVTGFKTEKISYGEIKKVKAENTDYEQVIDVTNAQVFTMILKKHWKNVEVENLTDITVTIEQLDTDGNKTGNKWIRKLTPEDAPDDKKPLEWEDIVPEIPYKDKNGNVYKYEISEDVSDNEKYLVETKWDAFDKDKSELVVHITNTPVEQKIKIYLEKIWNLNKADTKIKGNIEFTLKRRKPDETQKAETVGTFKLNADDGLKTGTTRTWLKLLGDEFDYYVDPNDHDKGKWIYFIEERTVAGFTTTYPESMWNDTLKILTLRVKNVQTPTQSTTTPTTTTAITKPTGTGQVPKPDSVVTPVPATGEERNLGLPLALLALAALILLLRRRSSRRGENGDN